MPGLLLNTAFEKLSEGWVVHIDSKIHNAGNQFSIAWTEHSADAQIDVRFTLCLHLEYGVNLLAPMVFLVHLPAIVRYPSIINKSLWLTKANPLNKIPTPVIY